jgi:pyruvate/2-oxoacid:ferredoxin oxidoreductase beta subunit
MEPPVTTATAPSAATLAPQAYKSAYKPIWCPGCGDYSVLSAFTKAFAALALRPEERLLGSRRPSRVPTSGQGTVLSMTTATPVAPTFTGRESP